MATFVEKCLACGYEKETPIKDGDPVTFNAFCSQCGQPSDYKHEQNLQKL